MTDEQIKNDLIGISETAYWQRMKPDAEKSESDATVALRLIEALGDAMLEKMEEKPRKTLS